jgi:uncharacterized membrane protein YozB (DUF420 family)
MNKSIKSVVIFLLIAIGVICAYSAFTHFLIIGHPLTKNINEHRKFIYLSGATSFLCFLAVFLLCRPKSQRE